MITTSLSPVQEAPEVQENKQPRNGYKRTEKITVWKPYQLVLFRVAFIFYLIMCVPTSWKWVQRLLAIDVFNMNYRDLYEIAGYSPDIYRFSSESGRWGILSYANWMIVLAIAITGGLIWTFLVRKSARTNYETLYYWLRVVVRYRIAVGIISFGFVKLFPTQMPYPSATVLNTDIIDFAQQKLYWYSVGIVPPYQVFLGFVEILGGVLLFFRKTSAFGATLIAIVLFNIAFANHSYDGGVHVYSAYFVLLSLFLLVYELPVIWKLLYRQQDVAAVDYTPVISTKWKRYLLTGIKAAIIFVYVALFFYIRLVNYFFENDPIKKEPTTPGLKGSEGYYAVTEFRAGDNSIPYSPHDTLRWQDAIFEKWSTLSFRVNNKIPVDLSNGGPQKKDLEKNFELSGIGGGRRFFYYEADTVKHLLFLQDKNKGFAGNEQATRGNAKAKAEINRPVYTLRYDMPSPGKIVLSGIFEKGLPVYIVLDKVTRPRILTQDRAHTVL